MSIMLRLGCAALVLGVVSVAGCSDDEEDGSGGSGATGASGSTTSSSASSASGTPTSSSSSTGAGGEGTGGEPVGGAGGEPIGGAGGVATGGAGGAGGDGTGGLAQGGAGGAGGMGQGGAGGGGSVVPAGWECPESWYDEVGNGEIVIDCDCSCGAPDPDCAVAYDFFYCAGNTGDMGATCNNGVCAPPSDWTCDPALYDQEGNGVANPTCDCECGEEDPDCAPSDNFPVGNCMAGEMCNAGNQCQPAAPAGWTCPPSYYGDDGCDCGCGVVDIDCADATVGSCQYCNSGCNSAGCPGTINPTNNAVCI